MKKTRAITVFTLLAILITGCMKTDFHVTDQQEWNKGALIWKRALDSMKVQFPGQQRLTFRVNETKELADDGICFKEDGTGYRFQGKTHFWAAPQQDTVYFNWRMEPKQTNKFQMWGAGAFDITRPYNDVFMTVDETHNFLSLIVNPVTDNQPFLVYYFHQVPQ